MGTYWNIYGSKGASRANNVESALKTKWRRKRTLDYTGAFMEACLNSYQYFSVIILVELLHDLSLVSEGLAALKTSGVLSPKAAAPYAYLSSKPYLNPKPCESRTLGPKPQTSTF